MESGFLDDMGSFRIEHGEKNRLNYFPLAAENGVMASITPELKGDLKRDQNSFVLPPASEEDLRSGMAGRNFWCRFENVKTRQRPANNVFIGGIYARGREVHSGSRTAVA